MSAAARAPQAHAPPFIDPPGYGRHRPERTLLYQLVEQHYPAFRELCAAADRPLPGFVHEEFDAYLKCGRLEEGFLRVRCEQCHAEKLVAFSCKKRGFCPSCGGRLMAETAALQYRYSASSVADISCRFPPSAAGPVRSVEDPIAPQSLASKVFPRCSRRRWPPSACA